MTDKRDTTSAMDTASRVSGREASGGVDRDESSDRSDAEKGRRMLNLKVGDKVFVNTSGRPGVGGFIGVVKVGRKYFKAGPYEFRLEDGKSTSGYSWPHAYTAEEHDENERLGEATDALRSIGITVDYGQRDRQGIILEVYQEIRAIIERRTDSAKD